MAIKSLGQVGTPGNDFDIANKKYVDDASGGPGALEHIRFTDSQVDFGTLSEYTNFAMSRTGTSSITSSQSPIPFDMTIVRMGLTIAVPGSTSGIDGNSLFQLWRSPSSGNDQELGAIALQAFLTSVDLEVNIPIVGAPGDRFAWRVINNDGTAGTIFYEIHMHYVEQAQLTESQKEYYKKRAMTFKNLDNQNLVRRTQNIEDTKKSIDKLFNAPKSQGDATSTSKTTAVITPTEGSTTVDNGTTAVTTAETNKEQRAKSKKSKSRYWKR